MASAWGYAWGYAFGDAWGAIDSGSLPAIQLGGGGFGRALPRNAKPIDDDEDVLMLLGLI